MKLNWQTIDKHVNTPKNYIFWIIWCITFAIHAFVSMFIKEATIIYIFCFLLQSGFAIFWTNKLIKAKKKIREEKEKEQGKQAMREVIETLG